MKKILTLALAGIMTLGGAAALTACNKPTTYTLYLVPGTYVQEGAQVENTLSDKSAKKLTEAECEQLHLDNVYQCSLAKGKTLPVPASTRTDEDGNAYTFNGWWTIVDATVTYFETMPVVNETTYLYADWRADLSQRKDPVIPDGGEEVEPNHYMLVQRGGVGEPERITLRKAYTDMMSAEMLGYLYPVELVAEGFELTPGDIITVYTTGLTDDEDAVIAPLRSPTTNRGTIQLEKSGEKPVDTANYLSADGGSSRRTPSMTYIANYTYTKYCRR